MKNSYASHAWELLWGMTEKELRARYKHTIFGFLWLVANPVLQMVIIGFIFPLFVKNTVPHYNYFLFTGLLLWNFFSLSLAKTTPSIVNERSLIKKAAFPRAVIPLSIIFSNLINYLAAFLLFLPLLALAGTIPPTSLLYFLAGLGLLLLFTSGISLLTSALNVRFRDVSFFVQALLIVWFYATPIIYSLSQIPPRLLWWWRFNPLTGIAQLVQHALVGAPLPDLGLLATNSVIILIITALGVGIFYVESKNFDDWL